VQAASPVFLPRRGCKVTPAFRWGEPSPASRLPHAGAGGRAARRRRASPDFRAVGLSGCREKTGECPKGKSHVSSPSGTPRVQPEIPKIRNPELPVPSGCILPAGIPPPGRPSTQGVGLHSGGVRLSRSQGKHLAQSPQSPQSFSRDGDFSTGFTGWTGFRRGEAKKEEVRIVISCKENCLAGRGRRRENPDRIFERKQACFP
jgi:hypothetical protein